jgi:uncharacterized membrane protein
MSPRTAHTRRLAVAAWMLLVASVAAWPFAGVGIGGIATAIAGLPLLLPLPGLLGSSTRALRAASLSLSPALVVAVTEMLVNPPARTWTGISLTLMCAAFAAIIAAIRVAPAP